MKKSEEEKQVIKDLKASINWFEIRDLYVSTNITIDKLAQVYNVSRATIARRSSEGKWMEERRKYREDVSARGRDALVDRGRARLVKTFEIASSMVDKLSEAMRDENQLHLHTWIDRDTGEINCKILDKIDARAAADISRAIKALADSQRVIAGVPTQAEQEAQRIAAERLILDKRRAEQEQRDRDASGSVTVVFGDAVVQDAQGNMDTVSGEDMAQ